MLRTSVYITTNMLDRTVATQCAVLTVTVTELFVFTWLNYCTIVFDLTCSILQYVYKPTRCTILVIRLYFPLDALHVSDYVSPSSGAAL